MCYNQFFLLVSLNNSGFPYFKIQNIIYKVSLNFILIPENVYIHITYTYTVLKFISFLEITRNPVYFHTN